MKTVVAALAVAVVALLPGAARSAGSGLAVVGNYPLGGDGGWDYLSFDPASRRLFSTRGEHVMVVDADSGSLVADIAGMNHAHGVALSTATKTGFVSNGHGDDVSVFDLGTLKVKGKIAVGKDPDAILFDPSTRHVFVANGHSNDLSVIDPAAARVVATIPVPGRPEFGVSDGKGHVYFNLEDKNQLSRIDASAAKVTDTWSLGTCQGPTGLAIDVAHQRLFSVCANRQMAVVDARDGHLVATVTIGDGPDSAAYDPGTATVYSANIDGTLTVIHEDDADHYSVVANVATPKRSRNLALDVRNHKVFLSAAKFGTPPPPTAAEPEPKPPMLPGSYAIVVVGKR